MNEHQENALQRARQNAARELPEEAKLGSRKAGWEGPGFVAVACVCIEKI